MQFEIAPIMARIAQKWKFYETCCGQQKAIINKGSITKNVSDLFAMALWWNRIVTMDVNIKILMLIVPQ